MAEIEEIWKPIEGFPGYYVSNLARVKTEKRRKGVLKPAVHDGYLWVSLVSEDGKVHLASIHRLVAQAFIPNPENKPVIDHINTIRDDNRVENLRWVTYSENARNEITLQKHRNKPSPRKGVKLSRETKEKISRGNSGKKRSEEFKDRVRKALSGEKNYLYGKHLSEETKQKLSIALKGKSPTKTKKLKDWWERNCGANHVNAKRIGQYSMNGELIRIWDCVSDAAREMDGCISNIAGCARGKKKSAYKFKWKYL